MTDLILNRWPRFGNYLALFERKLGKPARQHLLHLLIAFLIYDGAKNVTGLNRALYQPRTLSSVDRFLTEGYWNEAEFEQIRLNDLNHRVRRYLKNRQAKGQTIPCFLCIDDTNNPKAGDKSAGVSYQYSHLAGTVICCYCLVTAVVVVGEWVIPLTFRLYRRREECARRGVPDQFKKKVELAAELIRQWQPLEGTQPFVLVDSWYMSAEVLAACAKRHFTLIGGIGANRSIQLVPGGAYLQLQQYQAKLTAQAYQLVTLGSQRWQVASCQAGLKGGYQVKVLITKSARPWPQAKRMARFWVCTDPKLKVSLILEWYRVRWEIETFHRQAKQLLGWTDNQCHLERSVRRLWTLLMLAYSYLTIERVEHSEEYPRWQGCSWATLWQIQQQHKRDAHQAQAEWVYQAAQAGIPLATVLQQIKA